MYAPYQIKKTAERRLADQEVVAKKELASQVAKADFLVIIPTPPRGYFLVKDSSLDNLRTAAAEYYKSKMVIFEYQNAGGRRLTVNERPLKEGEEAMSFSAEKEKRWDSTQEVRLADGAVVY